MNPIVASDLNEFGLKLLHLLQTCKSISQLPQILPQILIHNLHPNGTITSQFIKTCQSLNHLPSALHLYHQIHSPKVFISNLLIQAFSHSQYPQTSLSIYTHMQKNSFPSNNYTFPFILKGISQLGVVKQGEMIHTQCLKLGHLSDIYVGNSLLNVYSSCREIGMCEKVFDEMPERDVVSWTTLVEGNRNAGKFDEAIRAFERMGFEGILPNRVTMVTVLSVCASLGAIEMGVWIHDFIRRNEWQMDVILGTSLIDMYAKCGRIDVGLEVFRSMKERNIFTWNSVLKGLALLKSGEDAVQWFNAMEREGIKPDEVTLIAVLNACSHSGMVQTGREIFHSIIEGKYGFPPNIRHYSCIIDMLGRAGYLDEALEFLKTMPFQPTKTMWGAFLSGCRAHGNMTLSEIAAMKLVELEPGNGAYYVLLSNLYAEMGRWNDVENIRRLMKERGLVKDLGSSSIELEDPTRQDYELLAT
ncbi:formamidase [Ranunculus cassubicifolius]